MEAKNECFSNYRKCNNQKGKSNISKKAASKVVFDDSKNTEFMKEILGSQFRNAVMHGNFCIMDTGDILLFDINNQYNPRKINKFFVISLENFVDLINNSYENSIDIYETETKNYLSRAIANLERFDRLSADWIENDLSIWDVINIKREDYLNIISDLYFIKYSENFDIRYNQNLLMDNIRDVSLLMWRVQDRIFNYIILNSWDENLINQYLFDREMECDRVTSAIENSTLFELFLESDKFIRNYIKWLDYCYITTVNNYEASIYGDDDFIEKKGKFNENLRYLCSKLKEISEMFNEPILVSNNKIGLKIKHKSF